MSWKQVIPMLKNWALLCPTRHLESYNIWVSAL
uniref:Uncharacterized protein n=1 Tax=Arundo donax TaxID=35708 RepID=A0A0A9B1R2_ARUDO